MNWLDTQLGIVDISVNTAEFALNWLLQSSLLLGLGLTLGRLLRQRGSALQSVVYRTTLAAVLICPMTTWGLSQAGVFGWSIDLAKSNESKAPQPTPTQITDEQLISTKHPVSPTPVETTLTQLSPTPGASLPATESDSILSTPATTEAPQSPLTQLPVNAPKTNSTNQFAIAAAAIWLLVSPVLLIRLANAWQQLAKLRRRSVPADEATILACQKLAIELQVSQPAVLRSPLLPSPCLAGLWRPTILLPEQNCELSLREVLIHELAHLRRHDCHWNLLRQTATALFFFQPLLWLLSRRLGASAEEVCDDYVVQHGGNRQQYAHRLVDIAELSLSPIAAAGVGMVSLRSMLGGRVQRIMDTSRTLSTRTGNVFLVAALLVGLTGTLVAGFIGLSTKPAQAVTAIESTTKAEKETDDEHTDNHSADKKDDAEQILITGTVVDPNEKPVEGVVVRHQFSKGMPFETKTDQQGEYKLSLPKKKLGGTALLARAPNGQLGYASLPYKPADKPLPIKLSAPHELKVMVRSAAGSPVAGIELVANADFVTLCRTTTNAKGEGTITLPSDANLQFVMAQGKQGVDYALFRHPRRPNNDPFLLKQDYNGPINLTLTPTITAKIRVVDKENRPIAGAVATPWYITLPDHGIQGSHANLGSLWSQTTDLRGYAYFPYLPQKNIHPLTIWVNKEGYVSTDRTYYDPINPANILIATMHRLLTVRGQVVDSTGKPAAGVTVQAAGKGHTTDDYHESTKTDVKGRFTMNVTPNMYYYFTAYGDKTAAPIVSKVIHEETLGEIKLQLQPATRVFGQLTVGPLKRPVANKHVSLYRHSDRYYELPEDQRLPNPNDHPYAITPRLIQGIQTDAEGKFEFYTGPGKHYIFGFNHLEATKFEVIKTSGEQEHDFHSPVGTEGTLRGRVVLAADKGQGMANIRVFGYPENLVGNHLRAATDENGNFETQQSGVPQLVGAFSKSRKLGAIQHVAAGSDYFELALAPTGTLLGTLVHEENGQPAIEQEIAAAIELTNDKGMSMSAFRKSATTDQEGKFKITGIVPGNIYKLSVVTGRDKQGRANGWRRVGTAEPKDASVLELGKLELATPSQPPALKNSVDAEEKGTVVLIAVDADHGTPIANVTFAIENSLAEDWATTVGVSNKEGKLQLKTKKRRGYFYSVFPVPKGYKITGLDAVPSGVVPGGVVEHRFHLRKLTPLGKFPSVIKDQNTASHNIPAPAPQKKNYNHQSLVDNMPGFEGQKIKFWFYPNKEGEISTESLKLSEHIFLNGKRVRAALDDELKYFQKAEGKLAGEIDKITDVKIHVHRSKYWVLWCRTKNGIKLRQDGFKIRFNELDSWELQVPDYLHPEF